MLVAEGDTVTLNVPQSCTEAVSVRALVRYVGTSAIWYEDIGNPLLPAFTTAEYEALDGTHTTHIVPTITNYFGDFQDVDGNQKTMIIRMPRDQAQQFIPPVWN